LRAVRERSIWLRRGGAAAGLLLLGLVFADLLFGGFTAIAAWVQHWVAQVVVWPFVLADAAGLVMHSPGWAMVQWGLVSAACVWLARSADGGSRTSQIQLDVVFATPLLLLGLAAFVNGLSAAPPVVVGCLLAAGFGGLAAQTGDEVATVLPGSGLPGGRLRYVAVFGGVLMLVVGASVLAIGSEPSVTLWALADLVPPGVWPWGLAAAGLGVVALGWVDRPGAVGRVAAAAMFGVFVTVVFVGWTAPDRRWERVLAAAPLPVVMAGLGALWIGCGFSWVPAGRRPVQVLMAATLPAIAALMGLAHTFATGALDCGRGAAEPFVTLVTPEPTALATGLDGDLWVITEGGTLRRWGGERGIDIGLGDGAVARGRTLGAVDGELRAWLQTGDGAVWVRVLDGAVVAREALAGDCVIGAWSPDDGGGGVATCTWGHRLLLDGDGVLAEEIQGVGGVDALIPNPTGGWLGIDGWTHPYLVDIDRVGRTAREKVTIGGFHGELRADPGSGVVAVARTVAGQVQFIDAASLELRGAVRADWGLRELVNTRWAWVAASPRTGAVVAIDPDAGVVARLLSPGVRDLALLDENTLVAVGRCGVETIDLRRWLGR